jgi:phytoene/squalene synthetase
MAENHYENFPVASVLLPSRLRRPVQLIYAFAREADDFADEGDFPASVRLANLAGFGR